MTTEEELVGAIRSDPDNVAPRLVYADWLQERGDPLGEFIALAIEKDRLDRDDSKRVRIDERLDELGFERAWKSGFDGNLGTLEGGMPAHLGLDGRHVDAELVPKLRGAMVRELSVGDVRDDAVLRTAFAHMALRRLHVSGNRSPAQLATLLAACLDIHALQLPASTTSAHLEAIANLPWRRLAWIGTGYDAAPIGDDGAIALTRIATLREVEARRSQIGKRGAIALVEGRGAIRSVDLTANPLGEAGVAAVAAAARELEVLEIAGTGFTDGTMKALASSRGLSSLRRLGLAGHNHRSNLTATGLAALIRSRYLSSGLVVALDGVALGLKPYVSFLDDGDWRSGWVTKPSGPLAERFRIEVADKPNPDDQ